jgi:hypothetical protein
MATNIVKWTLVLVALALMVIPAYAVLTKPDMRGVNEKVSDAFDARANGRDNGDQQSHDRALGRNLSDAVKNASDTF